MYAMCGMQYMYVILHYFVQFVNQHILHTLRLLLVFVVCILSHGRNMIPFDLTCESIMYSQAASFSSLSSHYPLDDESNANCFNPHFICGGNNDKTAFLK